MTKNSYICQLIANNPDTWEEILKQKNVRVKHDSKYPYIICKYEQFNADFSDPIVQEARGIIIDLNTISVACWPFRKFGNWQESYADDIDWQSAVIQEKIDGSIIKLWYNEYSKDWQFSTNNMINADGEAMQSGMTFLNLIWMSKEYNLIDFKNLDKNLTYIFELVSPYAQIVIRYPATRLYHTGTRNNLTGEELDLDIGIPKPKKYPFTEKHTLEACIRMSEELNKNGEEVENEGFVVVDKDYHRIKIKCRDYFELHRSITQTITKKNAIENILQHGIDETIRRFSNYEPEILYYAYQMAEYKRKVSDYCRYAQNLFDELGKDRKAFAGAIKNDRMAKFGFMAADGKNAKQIIEKLTVSQYADEIGEPDKKSG